MDPQKIHELKKKFQAVFGVNWKLLFAQAYHETGNFTSAIFLENNNLFGMKLPLIRPTTAIGSNRGHAVYESLDDSIKDMNLWLIYNKFDFSRIWTVREYVEWLKKRGYYEDNFNNYLAGLNNGMMYA